MSPALTRRRSKAKRRTAGRERSANALVPAAYFRWKALLDYGLAAVLVVPGLPLMLLCMGLIRLTSKGPAIYQQTRVGLHGRTFVMYKLRTMRQDAESLTGAVWTQYNDPRITRLGRFLRRVHLDELPQLFNVLRGEMSLVGPRPERPEFTQTLTRQIPRYMERHTIRPGVTGLAQINLPPDTDLNSVRDKLVLDLEYARTANLWLDSRIFLATLARMFRIHTRTALAVLGLRRKPRSQSEFHFSQDNHPVCNPAYACSAFDNSP